jgi:hypothetical protein
MNNTFESKKTIDIQDNILNKSIPSAKKPCKNISDSIEQKEKEFNVLTDEQYEEDFYDLEMTQGRT